MYVVALTDATPVVVPLPMIDEIKAPPHGALELTVTVVPGEMVPDAMLPFA